jgi:crossover junction endodeoxyribonuclease RuvC
MKILGIDPGSLNCGYGLISAQAVKSSACQIGGRCLKGFTYLSSGRIVMPQSRPLNERLKDLFDSLSGVIEECRPDEIVIERMFFAKGVKAALSLGHTRGVILLASTLSGLPIFEYSPLEVKQAVVGYGRADKKQVQCMVKEILKVRHELSADGADALAIALCHANMQGSLAGLSRQLKRTKAVRR